MRTEKLLVCLLALLVTPLPIGAQSLSENSAHPFRIKRTADESKASPASGKSDNPLQGGVTQVDVQLSDTEGPLVTPPISGAANGGNAPPALYRGWLEKTYPQFSLSTSTMGDKRLIVVYGKYDDTGRTLSSLGLQFTTISTNKLDTYDLSNTQVLVIDCPGGLSLQAMQKVRDFVAGGGYLFTTDWLLDRLDAQIFPATLAGMEQ